MVVTAVTARVAVTVTRVVTTTLVAPMLATSTNRDLSDLLDAADSAVVHAAVVGLVAHAPRDLGSKVTVLQMYYTPLPDLMKL